MINLYKVDAAGNIRHWQCRHEYDESQPSMGGNLIINHGILDGAYQEKTIEVRTNQSGRTLVEQLVLEEQSRANKKLDLGYCGSIEEAQKRKGTNAEALPRPMLAQPVKWHAIDWYWAMAQCKYDGHRCIVGKRDGDLVAYSRNGKPINSIDHILEHLMDLPEGVFLDGELYLHGTPLQTISSWVRRNQEDSRQLQYVVYDCMTQEPFHDRIVSVADFLEHVSTPNIVQAPTWRIGSQEQVMRDFRRARLQGFEGLVIRHTDAEYQQGKRAKQLMKVKDRISKEFVVTGITASADGWAVLHCLTNTDGKAGKGFRVSAPGDIEHRRYVLENIEEFVGRKVTVEFAYWTNDGIPGHPVATAFRDDV